MPANTGMCVSHGGPPAGHGSTVLLLPVRGEKESLTGAAINNLFQFEPFGL